MEVPSHVARAAMGLDYRGEPAETTDPILQRLWAVSPELDPVERANWISEFLDLCVEHVPDQIRQAAYLEAISDHFTLSGTQRKALKTDLKRKRASAASGPSRDSLSREQLLEKLEAKPQAATICPAQDYHGGKLYFTVEIDGQPYLISSDREIFSHSDAGNHGLTLKPYGGVPARISPQALKSYLEGSFPTDLAALLKKIEKYISCFVYLSDKQVCPMLAIWVVGTYMFKCFDYYPYVALQAEKQSGKTLLMRVMQPICCNGQFSMDPSEAVLFRDAALNCPTMFIDEAEHLSGKDKQRTSTLFSILNAGYQKGDQVKRVEKSAKDKFELKAYDVFTPKVFAGINDLDDVLASRSIPVRMLRKTKDEPIQRYKVSKEIERLQQEIVDECYVYSLQHGPNLARLYKGEAESSHFPEHLTNRELDLWEPLLLIAEAADVGSGGTEFGECLSQLSLKIGRAKLDRDRTDNETAKILTVLNAMISDPAVQSVAESASDWQEYRKKDVVDFFQNSDEFGQISQNVLTRKLKRMSKDIDEPLVTDGQRRSPERKTNERTYRIHLSALDEMSRRYLESSSAESTWDKTGTAQAD